MANFIIKKTDRDHREAAYKAGLSLKRYSGLARSEDEAHEVMRSRGGNDRPDDVLAFDDGGQSDREQMKTAGITEEQIERRGKKKR